MFNSALLLALSASYFIANVKDCSSGTSLFILNSAVVMPDTPKAGDNVSLTIDYTVPTNMTVTDGTAEFAITYAFIPITPTIEPLCANVACPVVAGRYTNESISVWPSGISGTVTTQMKWYNTGHDLLLCVGITWKTLSSDTRLLNRGSRFRKPSASASPMHSRI